MDKFSFSLSKKALLALAVILLPIIIIFIYSFQKNVSLMKSHVLDDLNITAEAFEGQVFQFLEMSKRMVTGFSTDGLIKKELKDIIDKKTSPDVLNRHLSNNKLKIDGHTHAIFIISPSGKVVSSTDISSIGKDVSAEPYFKNGRSDVSVIELSENRNTPELTVSAPIISDSGNTLGVITCFIHLSELDKVLNGEFNRELGALTWGQSRHKTLEVYLVNRDKLMLTRSKFVKDAILKQKVDTLPVSACLEQGREVNDFYKDYRGIDVAGSSRCFPSLKWTFIVEYDYSEALAPAMSMRRTALIATAVVAGLIVLLFIVFFRNIIVQLQRISLAARKIAVGDYGARIPVESDDEIGYLSDAFNNMASDINSRSIALKLSEEKYRTLVSNIPDVTWTADREGNISFISHNVADVLGYTQEEMHADSALKLRSVYPDDIMNVISAYSALFTEGANFNIEYRIKRKDGTWIWIHEKASFTYAKNGIRYTDGVFSDISEKKYAEEALKRSEERLEKAQHIARMGSWDWDISNDTLLWSDEIYSIFGVDKKEFAATYEAFIKAVHPEDRDFVEDSVFKAVNEKEPYSIEHRIIRPDGAVRTVHEQGEVTYDPQGRPVRMLGTVQDITERKQAEFELKKLSMIIEHSVNLIFITDVKGNIEYVNPTFEQVTGYTKEEAIGQTPRILSSGELPNEAYEELWKTILSGKTWRSILKNKKKTGGFYWCNSIITPIRNEQGEITHFLAVQEDTTDKMLSEERIKYLAHYDDLTGLLNRSTFIELIDEWINSNKGNGDTAAFLLVDMDQFKFLNDTYGHGAGDEYLRRIGKFFQQILDKTYGSRHQNIAPYIARLSGDEFALFLPKADEAEGFEIAERLRKSVESFRFTEMLTSSTISIGVVKYPDHGADSKSLFTRGDAAMYRAKELGRNRCHLYRPEDKDLEKMHSRLSWKEKIVTALKESRFEPWFQPILDLKDNTIHHYEALARMRAEDGTVLLPGAFIDIAERFGLIGEIDMMIIEKAIRFQAEMRRKGKNFSFGMNLSGKDLVNDELLQFISEKIEESGADPSGLIFEITETAAISDLERAKKFIKCLQNIGCHFALDDFGVGFTSFVYLKEMQVDYIKIDGSFIRKLHVNPDDQVLVRAMTDVAKGLNIKTIAEFVEVEETLGLLRDYGVDFVQGYLIGKPAPALVGEREYIEKASIRKEAVKSV